MRCPLSTQSGLMQRNKKPGFGAVLFVQTYTQTSPDLVMFISHSWAYIQIS
jgi:hypothetical protein